VGTPSSLGVSALSVLLIALILRAWSRSAAPPKATADAEPSNWDSDLPAFNPEVPRTYACGGKVEFVVCGGFSPDGDPAFFCFASCENHGLHPSQVAFAKRLVFLEARSTPIMPSDIKRLEDLLEKELALSVDYILKELT
jgi:hypothetical protein